MKKIIVSLCTVLLLGMAGCGTDKTEEEKMTYQEVSPEEAQALMQVEESYVILDVRTQEEYDAGHIPNAICIPNETITDKEPKELEDKEQLILVYCRSGNRSKQAAEKLADMGYANVVEFGGITDWPGEIEQ